MGYPEQSTHEDRHPAEDADRPLEGDVIDPADGQDFDATDGHPRGAHAAAGDDPLVMDSADPADDQVVLESNAAGPVTTTEDDTMMQDAPERDGGAIPMPGGTGPAAGTAPADPSPTTPDPTVAAPAATTATPAPAGTPASAPVRNGDADQEWNEIRAMFVDDPRAATERAASLVDSSVEAFVASVRNQQQSLASSWQGDAADTEAMRTALQQYRAFHNQLAGFNPAS
jgi:hypothetical protein